MIVAAILLGICQVVTMFGVCLLFRHFINAKQAEIERRADAALRAWVESPQEGEPSKLAVLVDAMGAVIGSAAARSLMASLKQQDSAVAQVANGVSDRLQGQTHPLQALLVGGKRGKGAALLRLAELLEPMLAGKSNGDGAGAVVPRKHRE
jgi:hypothetical protein